jgi:hypothetical protein
MKENVQDILLVERLIESILVERLMESILVRATYLSLLSIVARQSGLGVNLKN